MAYDNLSVGAVVVGNSSGASSFTVNCGTGGANFGTSANAHTTTIGSTNTTCNTLVQSGSNGIALTTSSNGTIGLTSGTGTISISADATATTLNIGTGAGVKSVFLGSTNTTSATTVQSGSGALNVTATNGALTINSGTGALTISGDATATTVAIAQGAGVKTVAIGSTNTTSVTTIDCGTGGCDVGVSANAHLTRLGSTNSTSATTVQSGSGTLSITATNGAITMNSGTGTVSIGSDATAATYNFATGAGAKVVTLGSTNGASSLALKTGTADFSLASATGTIMSALDTGEITYPLQPAFLGYLASTALNKTGNGTAYTLGTDALTEVFDQNSDFNTNGTFTAPVTGKYKLTSNICYTGTTNSVADAIRLVTSNRSYDNSQYTRTGPSFYAAIATALADMDAADTCTTTIAVSGEAGDTVDIFGGTVLFTYFCGNLVC